MLEKRSHSSDEATQLPPTHWPVPPAQRVVVGSAAPSPPQHSPPQQAAPAASRQPTQHAAVSGAPCASAPRSHVSPSSGSTTPLPQPTSHTLAPTAGLSSGAGVSAARHTWPHSTAHPSSQPSPAPVLPSSQPSPASTTPSPHVALAAAARHPPDAAEWVTIVAQIAPPSLNAFSPPYAISPPVANECGAPSVCPTSCANVRHSSASSDETAAAARHARPSDVHDPPGMVVASAQWPLASTATPAHAPSE